MHALSLSLMIHNERGDPEAGRVGGGARVTIHACSPVHALLLRSGRGNPVAGRVDGGARSSNHACIRPPPCMPCCCAADVATQRRAASAVDPELMAHVPQHYDPAFRNPCWRSGGAGSSAEADGLSCLPVSPGYALVYNL